MECHTLDPGFHGRLSCLPGVSPGSFPFLLRIFEGGRPFVTRGLFIEGEEKKENVSESVSAFFIVVRVLSEPARGSRLHQRSRPRGRI